MNKQVVGEIMMLTLAALPFAFIMLEELLDMIRSRAWRDFVVLLTITVWVAVGVWLILS